MTIRLATLNDLGAIRAIVREVVHEMMTLNNSQWDDTYPDEARFVRDIESNALYVMENLGQVIGFVTIDQIEPDGYRGLPWSDNSEALVIHRFAVAQNSRSLGVASLLEKFACEVALSRGMHLIKVDTYSTNAGMQTFLAKKGYRKVGDMEFRGKELPFYCYEKILR